MIEKLHIQGVNPKPKKDGSLMWKVDTDKGVYYIFDEELAKELSKLFQSFVDCEVLVSKTGYKSIQSVSNSQGSGVSNAPAVSSYNPGIGPDDKQKYIIRQSCLKAAVEGYTGVECTAKDIIALAEVFEEWVNR